MSDRYREYREDHEEDQSKKREKTESREQPEQEQDEDPEWERRCNDALDKVESQSEGAARRETEADDWEERCNRVLDKIEEQAECTERKGTDSIESAEEKELSNWEEKCERALDRVESEAQKNESEGPDKDEIVEVRDRLHDEFVDDMEKKLDDEETNADEAIESLSADTSTSNETNEEGNSGKESGDGTVSSLIVEHLSEEAQENNFEPEKGETEENSHSTPKHEQNEKEPESDEQPDTQETQRHDRLPSEEDVEKEEPEKPVKSTDEEKEEIDENPRSEETFDEKEVNVNPETVERTNEGTNEKESDSEKKEHETYPERITPGARETDPPSEEENPEPSEKFREEYESTSQPTQFSENDRVSEFSGRVVDELERSIGNPNPHAMTGGDVEEQLEPALGKIEHADGYTPEDSGGAQLQATHEVTEADTSEGVDTCKHQHTSSSSGDTPERATTETQTPMDGRECNELEEDAEKGERSVEQRLDEIDRKIEQNPHLRRKNSAERYAEYETYKEVMRASPEVSDSTLSEKYNEGVEKVQAWREEKLVPRLVVNAERHDMEREAHEAEVPEEALGHRIDWSEIRDAVKEIPEKERLTTEELTTVVEAIYRCAGNPELGQVRYAEMYEAGLPLGEDELRTLAKGIRANREEVERGLNERLGYAEDSEREVRLAVTDDRVYYWDKYSGPDTWLNVLAKERFYFHNREDKFEMIDETTKSLHVRGSPENAQFYLSDILNQMSRLENPTVRRVRRYGKPAYLDGETLHFMGDALGRSLKDMKPSLSYLGMREGGRVWNLKFPDIHEYRMKFVAIAESDCHLTYDCRFSYYEKNPERRKIAIQGFQEFGDFKVKYYKKDKKEVHLPMPFGTMANHWGIPRGDKAIHNRGLDESVRNEELEEKVKYPIEMVPEDGCFSNGRFSITRHNALHAGDKAETYRERFGIEPLVRQEHIDFVCDYAERKKGSPNFKEGKTVKLTMTELRHLAESSDPEVSRDARELVQIIEDNPNRLLEDEDLEIIKALGIEMSRSVTTIFHIKDSKRLSIKSVAATKTIDDAIRWALLAPPNHPVKMEKVVKFIAKRQSRVAEIRKQIARDGLDIHPIWEEYGL